MAQDVCFLCRARAAIEKRFDKESTSLLTAVNCTQCGRYQLTPQAWTSHQRACLAAYVAHENQAKRQPPRIHPANWEVLVRLGEALQQKH